MLLPILIIEANFFIKADNAIYFRIIYALFLIQAILFIVLAAYSFIAFVIFLLKFWKFLKSKTNEYMNVETHPKEVKLFFVNNIKRKEREITALKSNVKNDLAVAPVVAAMPEKATAIHNHVSNAEEPIIKVRVIDKLTIEANISEKRKPKAECVQINNFTSAKSVINTLILKKTKNSIEKEVPVFEAKIADLFSENSTRSNPKEISVELKENTKTSFAKADILINTEAKNTESDMSECSEDKCTLFKNSKELKLKEIKQEAIIGDIPSKNLNEYEIKDEMKSLKIKGMKKVEPPFLCDAQKSESLEVDKNISEKKSTVDAPEKTEYDEEESEENSTPENSFDSCRPAIISRKTVIRQNNLIKEKKLTGVCLSYKAELGENSLNDVQAENNYFNTFKIKLSLSSDNNSEKISTTNRLVFNYRQKWATEAQIKFMIEMLYGCKVKCVWIKISKDNYNVSRAHVLFTNPGDADRIFDKFAN